MVIKKLKDRIKSLCGKESVEKVKKDIDEIETINIELEHSMAKLLFENENLRKQREHLKSIYKDQFDSIKKTRVFAVTTLKNELRKLKRKYVVDTVVSTPIATTIALGIFKLDIEPISHRLKNNRDAHEDYSKKTIKYTDTISGLVECARKQNPSEPILDSACSTWVAFRGNTRDLGSFGEETDEITDLHQIYEEILFSERGDGVTGIKRRRCDPSSDDVRDLVMTSRRGRLNEDLESSS
ncbi:hypothetical protein Tco_0749964 [Tanacetum coccineum]|uniref:Uncharacterized protein n=1 Tax=Tanacetum coccineum TaxID=301880 RepID=A0ABQ4Z3K0_9ASTR